MNTQRTMCRSNFSILGDPQHRVGDQPLAGADQRLGFPLDRRHMRRLPRISELSIAPAFAASVQCPSFAAPRQHGGGNFGENARRLGRGINGGCGNRRCWSLPCDPFPLRVVNHKRSSDPCANAYRLW